MANVINNNDNSNNNENNNNNNNKFEELPQIIKNITVRASHIITSCKISHFSTFLSHCFDFVDSLPNELFDFHPKRIGHWV